MFLLKIPIRPSLRGKLQKPQVRLEFCWLGGFGPVQFTLPGNLCPHQWGNIFKMTLKCIFNELSRTHLQTIAATHTSRRSLQLSETTRLLRQSIPLSVRFPEVRALRQVHLPWWKEHRSFPAFLPVCLLECPSDFTVRCKPLSFFSIDFVLL